MRPTIGPKVGTAVLLAVLSALVLGLGSALWPEGSTDATDSASATSASAAAAAPTTRAAEPESPSPQSDGTVADSGDPPSQAEGATLTIETIGLRTTLSGQGLRNGEIDPDPGQVIWFTGNGRVEPGREGVTVLAAHVANGPEPDVFARLGELEVGDRIDAAGSEGTLGAYTVTRTYTATKEQLRADPTVWGELEQGHRIVLVTCDDVDGFAEDGHRVSNLVVVATPAM